MNDESSLVGKFFHSFKRGEVEWQGRITKRVTETKYLVQLYSWIHGGPGREIMVDVSKMSNWEFYDDPDDWKYQGDIYGEASRRKQEKD